MMRRTLAVARRVAKQLLRNPRFLALSVAVPLVVVYFLKPFFDTLPEGLDVARYAVPVAAFLVFLLCAISLVQERTAGTMERMFANGFGRVEILGGYALGLLAIGSVMSGIFVSTFARREAHVFPLTPLIIPPYVFLSGLLVDVDELPGGPNGSGTPSRCSGPTT
jgi:ABC-2 type transport system permease protein